MTTLLKATAAAVALALAAAAPAAFAETQLTVQADKTKPLPIPQGAEQLGGDPARGTVEFKHAATVLDVSAFYVREMPKLGYAIKTLMPAKDTMAVHEFAKDGKRVSMTIMKFGPKTMVRANGDALVAVAATAAAPAIATPPAVPALPAVAKPKPAGTLTLDQLTAEPDKSGWPVPKPNVNAGRGAMPGMIEATARVKTDVPTLAAFYRRELPKLKWTENPGGTDTRQSWTAPDGAATVELIARGDESEAVVTWRKAK
jgi:hypothetical protein